MNQTKVIALLLCALGVPIAHADHNPLIPRPQQIQYDRVILICS
jgi:hypothetical protein